MIRLGLDEAALEGRGALWTAREILQQPAMLLRTHQLLEARRSELDDFLQPLLARPELCVVLAGAGTSALIGECLSPFLRSRLPCRVEAIATTDIASAPELYLQRGAATLLVSFARSGNSPESVATAELADRFVDETHHLVITCNPDGALAKHGSASSHGRVVLLPEETHDKSFAMTSSFSCMTYAALAALTGIERMQPRIELIARAVDSVLSQQAGPMQVAAEQNYERVVFLGSHVLRGLAREAALKLLELTDGAVISACESPMGFRHGPKTIVNERTLVVVFLSNHRHTRQYDLDMLHELRRDATAARVLAVSAQRDGARDPADCVHVPHLERADDVELLFPYIAAPQLLAFHESLRRGLSPDNPNRSGTVSRVVQGVRIHAVR